MNHETTQHTAHQHGSHSGESVGEISERADAICQAEAGAIRGCARQFCDRRGRLHLSDASRDSAARSGCVSQVRHDLGTGGAAVSQAD